MAYIFIQERLGWNQDVIYEFRACNGVDENMKLEVLEAGSQKQTDRKFESKARFIQYIEYYYDDITCRGDGIPNLIKLRELMAQLPDTNHGVKNG